MKSILSTVRDFARDEDGASASEYAVLVALVVVAVSAAVAAFDIDGIYTTVSNKVKACVGGGAC